MRLSDPNPAPPNDAGAAGDACVRLDDTPPAAQIAGFLRRLFRDGDVFEVRAPRSKDRPGSTFTSTISGYYTFATIEKAAADIAALDARRVAPGIYVTLNPVRSDLLGRAANVLKPRAERTTTDSEVAARRWLLLDFDPVRASGISSTDAELAAALARADIVAAKLRGLGWPDPIVGLSGNGGHLIYAIDLPADDGRLVERVLAALAERFDDDDVKIDHAVFNPSRITKVFGTLARKGDAVVGIDGVDDRPHRRAKLLSAPADPRPVPRELLEQVAGSAPSATATGRPRPERPAHAGRSGEAVFQRFDHTPAGVTAYLERFGVRVTRTRTKGDTTWLDLDRCPVVAGCASEGGRDISVGVGVGGKIVYKNQHSRGQGLEWADVREAFEPGYRAWRAGSDGRGPSASSPAVSVELVDPWREPLPLHAEGGGCPFPIAEAFPPALGSVREYVQAVAETLQVPVDAPAMLLLPVVAVAMAQKVEIDVGWLEPCAWWSLVLMNSAERKTATLGYMQRPIIEWEREKAQDLAPIIARERAERSIDEKRLEVLRRRAANGKSDAADAGQKAIELAEDLASRPITTAPRLITTEPTPEALSALLAENRERILVAAAEADAFDVMLGRYSERGTPNLGIYLCGHSGDPCRIDRRGRAPIMLHRPTLSVGMIVQPEGVRGMFASRAARGRGLLGRFQASVPVSLVGSRKIRPDKIPPGVAGSYDRALRWMLSQPIPTEGAKIIVLSPDAQQEFDAFRAWIERELARGGGLEDQREWGGKLAGSVARLCVILHVLRAAIERPGAVLDEAVGVQTVQAALCWAPYFIAHQRLVAGVVGADPETGTAGRILAWLGKTGAESFSKRDAFNALRNSEVRQVGDLDAPLRLLGDLGYIRGCAVHQWVGPGRKPSPAYQVNPLWRRDRGAGR